MIKLLRGSIFNSKCDLIIIPCNSMGGVSPSIQKEIIANDLPHLYTAVQTGSIVFTQNISGFSNASMIGYAASVDASSQTSDKQSLRGIMQEIRNCCREQSLLKVNIPLLGTGAGGLSAKESYDVMRAEFENDSEILLCVYALSNHMYDELVADNISTSSGEIKNPRVFISYASSSMAGRNWVKDFACRLRKCGVNARLDIFHLKPGQDLPQWMTNELIMADKVLLICDKYYAEKADNRKGGVGWETMIIQGDMLSRQQQNKYIAILRDTDIDQSLPIYVKSRYALDWTDENQIDEKFKELLLCLFDCDVEPPIGEIPTFIREKLAQQIATLA